MTNSASEEKTSYSEINSASTSFKEKWINLLSPLETAISEGWSFSASQPKNSTNIFGRLIQNIQSDASLAHMSGLSATGLRAASVISDTEILQQYSSLSSSAERLLSHITYLGLDQGHHAYHKIADAGHFQWMARDPQEAVDLGLISHRIAELSLITGVVGLDENDLASKNSVTTVQIPEWEKMRQFLGDADDNIESVTPAQKIIFGNSRRRIPNWFSFDHPTFNALQKNAHAKALELAAKQPFFYAHLNELISQVLNEFQETTGRSISSIETYQTENAEFVVLVQGNAFDEVKEAVDRLRDEKFKVGCIRLVQLRPFPDAELVKLLSQTKMVTVLEKNLLPHSGDGILFQEINSALHKANENSRYATKIFPDLPALPHESNPRVISGSYGMGGQSLKLEEIISVFENMTGIEPSGNSFFGSPKVLHANTKSKFMVGVSFIEDNHDFPKTEAETAHLKATYPNLDQGTLSVSSSSSDSPVKNEEKTDRDMPLVVRRFHDQGPQYTKLSHFQNQIGVFYQENRQEELNATPLQAITAVPAATSELQNLSFTRTQFPVFIPTQCNGCGDCLIQCPDAALASVSVSLEKLLQTGSVCSAEQGEPIAQLTPLLKPIAQAAGKKLRESSDLISDAEELLKSAFGDVLIQKKYNEEKCSLLTAEFQNIIRFIKDFPLAKTDFFFDKTENMKRGSGELFSLIPDPYSCSGCGICTAICAENALEMVGQTSEILDDAYRQFSFWEQLPDTSNDTMKRLLDDAEYKSLAAVLLSRNFYKSTGHSAFLENNTGQNQAERTVLHLLVSLSESVTQPAVAAMAGQLADLHKKLADQIHGKMSDALPHEKFDVLAQTLSGNTQTRIHFDELLHQINEKEHSSPVDITPLRRMVALEQSVQGLHWALTEGPTGMGRSRMGMSIVGKSTMEWGKAYPSHPFFFPVWAQDNDKDSAQSQGLIEGNIRHFLDNIRLVRRTELEAQGKYKPHQHDNEIAKLCWEDLSETERMACPPIFLMMDHQSLNERSLSSWSGILNSPFPVRVVVLDSTKTTCPLQHASALAKVSLLAMTYGNAFVTQTSVSQPDHFHDSLIKGLQSPNPALFHIHVPDSELADELLCQSNAFPLMLFNPGNEGIFGNLIELNSGGNKSTNSEESEFTFADWAFTQERFSAHFTEIPAGSTDVIPLRTWMKSQKVGMNFSEKEEQALYIEQKLEDSGLRFFQISREMIKASILIRDNWRQLLEVAGEVTPFTQNVREELQQDLVDQHQAEIAQLQKEYEQKLSQMESDFQQKTKNVVRDRLLQLAGYNNNSAAGNS